MRRPRDERDRDAPKDEGDPERHGKPPSLQRHRPEGSEQATHAYRRRQVPDGTRAGPEQAENSDHDQHIEATADEGLRGGEGDEEPWPGRGGDEAEAVDHEVARAGGVSAWRRLDPAFDEHALEQAGRG